MDPNILKRRHETVQANCVGETLEFFSIKTKWVKISKTSILKIITAKLNLLLRHSKLFTELTNMMKPHSFQFVSLYCESVEGNWVRESGDHLSVAMNHILYPLWCVSTRHNEFKSPVTHFSEMPYNNIMFAVMSTEVVCRLGSNPRTLKFWWHPQMNSGSECYY
jgi:hypothetical protein